MSGNAYIKSLSIRPDATVCVSCTVSNDSGAELVEFVILDELISNLSLGLGEISEDVLCELDRLNEVTAAYMSACSSLAFTQSSLKALYRKLVSKGFSKEQSLEAVEIVRVRGFVNESEIAARRAELMISKLWGRARIFQKLREEGFPDSAMEEVCVLLENTDFSDNCAKLIEKKFSFLPEDRYRREKVYASLVRYGYSSKEIKKAIEIIEDSQ